jgi:phosphoribosylformylglycinamidine synthase
VLSDLACASQRGLCERFDGSIGAGTVLFPFGGSRQGTPEAGMAAKLPALPPREASTASLMAHGYAPEVSAWSPWHGAQAAVVLSLAKIAALGGDALSSWLSFQEYFPKTASPEAWGLPLAALLGALEAQIGAGCAAIGGKDSMSGSFGDLAVPPTLVSFAVAVEDAGKVRGGAFTGPGKNVFLLQTPLTASLAPDYGAFRQNMGALYGLGDAITAAYPVERGGAAEALSKMAFGNRVGLVCALPWDGAGLFTPRYGSLLVETSLTEDALAAAGFAPGTVQLLGRTTAEESITVEWAAGKFTLPLDEALAAWEKPLSEVFPAVSGAPEDKTREPKERTGFRDNPNPPRHSATRSARPRVLIPVFAGTNCEYDTERAFLLAGAETDVFVFRNNTPHALSESLGEFARRISCAQILALPGGFSAGDEPDGSGKYIANVLREGRVRDATLSLLKNRDGLILGICNGFQALVKTGLVPYGDILEPSPDMPTLTFNRVGRHISRIVRTRMASSRSPWAQDESVLAGVTHLLPVSHGEGRLIVGPSEAARLFAAGQVFARYAGPRGEGASSEPDNPNGSAFAIEGLTSPCGRVLGKMGHSERLIGGRGANLLKNIPEGPGESKTQNIFAAGVRYFS